MKPLEREERIPVREVTRKPRIPLRTDDYARAFVPAEFPSPKMDLRSLTPTVATDREDVSLKSLLRRLEPIPEAQPEVEPEFNEADFVEEPTQSDMHPDEWSKRRMMFLAVGGVGALFGLAMMGAALVFISIAHPTAPTEETATAQTQPLSEDAASRALGAQPAPGAQPSAAAAAVPTQPGDNVDRTLQQFIQWRQRTGAAAR